MTNTDSPDKLRFPLLFFLAGLFFINFVSRIISVPLMPVIEKDLGFGHSGAGFFFMMVAFGYSTGLITSGLVSSRITHRGTIALATVGTGAALLLIALVSELWLIRAGLFLVGVFTGTYLPSGITTITSSTASAHWGKALAIHELAPGLAFISTPFLAEWLLLFLSWRLIITSIGCLALIAGFAFWRFSAGGDFKGEKPTFRTILLVTGNMNFWIMVVLFCAAIAMSLGLYNMMPLYLTSERGIERGAANALLGFSRILSIPAAFLAGWFADRFGIKKAIFAVVLFNGIAAILLGLLPGKAVISMIFMQALFAGSFFPAGFAALSRIVPASVRGLSVSFTVFIAGLVGSGLVPVFLGIFGDRGMFDVSFVIIGISVLATLLLIGHLKLQEGRPIDHIGPQGVEER